SCLRLSSTVVRIDFLFFFQAEDGIRDRNVTGVQTCALPISAEDLAFHEALYRPLDNELVMDLLWVFWSTFHEIDPRLPGPHYTPSDACGWHEGLLEALEQADVDLYRSRMRAHFDGVRIRLSKAEQ